jgi:hypothetical protein
MSGECVTVHVPMTFKRRSGRKQAIVPGGSDNGQDNGPNCHEALVIAISRAHRWKKLLDEGRYPSVAAMARALKIDRCRVARLLRLTLLAPDIVEAVLDGREPEGLSLRRLIGEIPSNWGDQRREYGFEAATDL